MANSTAAFTVNVTYLGPDDETTRAPTFSVSAPYGEGAQTVGGIDVPDLASSATEYSIPFGAVAAATALFVENKTGQDVHVRINGLPSSVTGTLISGTKTVAFASVTGEHLSAALGAANGGTPGILSVRRSGGNVIVESWVAGVGIQVADVSDFTVYNGGSPNLYRLPDLGAMLIAMPAAAGGSALASASVVLTGSQTGAGSISYKVFGDPT